MSCNENIMSRDEAIRVLKKMYDVEYRGGKRRASYGEIDYGNAIYAAAIILEENSDKEKDLLNENAALRTQLEKLEAIVGHSTSEAKDNERLQRELKQIKSERDAALLHWAELQIKLYGTEVYDEYYDGLKPKYRVFKMEDGTLVDGCFVLRPDKDHAAREALRFYATKTENSQLAKDIYDWVGPF